MESRLQLEIGRQPDQYTCGPTCLQAVYQYFSDEIPLGRLIEETSRLENGGTLAVYLACHALERGYHATIYTWNLQVFDPTWFEGGATSLSEHLKKQREFKQSPRVQEATAAYLRYLELGGKLKMEDLSFSLIRRYLRKDIPILTGLSATYLYQEQREFGIKSVPDSIQGTPQGHFVVLCGYEPEGRQVLVADPLHPNPLSTTGQQYLTNVNRLICSIMLGIVTYDANLLILTPPHAPVES